MDQVERGEVVRVLLVSHEASRSGAPRVAVLVARSLVEAGHSLRLVSRVDGPLVGDFREVAPTSVEFLPRVRRRLRSHRLTRGLAQTADTVVAAGTILRHRPDLVYVNSTAAAAYLRPAKWLRRRVVLHVHESREVSRRFLGAVHATGGLPGVELLACSPSVHQGLADLVHRDPDEIALLLSVPDCADVLVKADGALEPPIDPNELIVGCCGTVEARKGADIWVAAARRVLAERPDRRLRFVWVGDISEPIEVGVNEPIDFIGPAANPYPHICRFDIATLPSRDDPFPLVVLESMVLGTPVVAFGVGGVPQQIGDAGVVVEPGDVDRFVESILWLVDNPEARSLLATAARERVESNFSVLSFAETLLAILGQDSSQAAPR